MFDKVPATINHCFNFGINIFCTDILDRCGSEIRNKFNDADNINFGSCYVIGFSFFNNNFQFVPKVKVNFRTTEI